MIGRGVCSLGCQRPAGHRGLSSGMDSKLIEVARDGLSEQESGFMRRCRSWRAAVTPVRPWSLTRIKFFTARQEYE